MGFTGARVARLFVGGAFSFWSESVGLGASCVEDSAGEGALLRRDTRFAGRDGEEEEAS